MRYPFLLFDADHTLFDFDQAQDRALKSTIVELHGHFDADYFEVYNEVNRRLWVAFELSLIHKSAPTRPDRIGGCGGGG